MPKPKAPLERNALARGPENQAAGLQLKGRIWLEKDGDTFLSWGRVVLLERIAEHGTLAAAARSMNMSYSHAWNLVEQMNRMAPEPLVEKQAGGKKGGGASLTPAGEKARQDFWRLVKQFQVWVEGRKVK
ncbi:MAG: LysR family transcriptional regulator [Desulfarculus sp.]|nr:LysR family transcriptional regulator [Pseudomonadota bacterium]MBV1717934.1 LysR family transcriptional regulator [Desulfarculus sp.]MBU4576592.1 LysR family transcriptional regulator [Pseudomonadota bacterium]MBU4598078.1 LysR family transcriptional regulator [Pseudomonadota bacterium]MBV1739452.1 LysR family transcriptional regulator [Desulfarculus sp.]